MSRGSFGRTVARAAASGGSGSYRARRPAGFYLLIAVIVIGGIFLAGYSRNEKLHPKTTAASGPTATSNWFAALAINICGVNQTTLAADSSTAGIGLRTFGDGLINIDPGAAGTTAANTGEAAPDAAFTGSKATLALFASSYPKFTLTSEEIQLPAAKATAYKNGTACTKTAGKGVTGKGQITIRVWASPTAKTFTDYTDPANVHLRNGQMITVGFDPKGYKLAEPASKAALVKKLG